MWDPAEAMSDNRFMTEAGWAGLFKAAFTQSRNPMLLADEARRIVDVNGAFLQLLGYKSADLVGRPVWTLVEGGPQFTPTEWAQQLARSRFTGEVGLIRADGAVALHQWGATVEAVTGRRLVLAVVLGTSRWGGRFRRTVVEADDEAGDLSARELEVVHHVAHGRSGPEIADELGIAHDTVRTHVRNAMEKVGARSRAHLVAKALGEGHALR
jgi:PAS domain S-box-containing protein